MNQLILVIDDDEAIRKSFSLTLNDAGFSVHLADSGKKGINQVRSTAYALIFLDLKMPGLNGCKTLSEIRKINQNVPIYIITAFHEEFFSELKELDDNEISYELLKKPVDRENLIALAKSILFEPQLMD